MKIAIVYDRINKYGGAERVLQALHELWPEAPVYTAVYDPVKTNWTKGWRIVPSFLQYFPYAKTYHEFYPWLTPMAFESFNFDGFDVVLSVTSAEAKSVITKPETVHICYCLTPTRYLWSGYKTYASVPGWGSWDWLARRMLTRLRGRLRDWDEVAASRPDHYIAISNRVAARIEKYYGRRPVSVIYPPVDTETFCLSRNAVRGEFFLAVSRLVGYKRLDLLVSACTKYNLPLVIVGSGWAENNLRQLAGPCINIVTTHLTDRELAGYYQSCLAYVHAGDEDFGIAAVEAQASGKPVISLGESGLAEIVREGKTGGFFSGQTVDEIGDMLRNFKSSDYKANECRENALRFSKQKFKSEISEIIKKL